MPIHALLLSSVVLRPYVFAFLAAFLIAAAYQFGWKRTFAFLAIGFGVAFAAEYSSTHWAVPFGLYHYTGDTRDRELFLANVPFFDSLSFVFLAYASYAMALFFRLNHVWRGGPLDLDNEPSVRQGPSVLLLSGLFMTWLDVVIDPLAVRGHEWFLGKIFWYEDPGWFYGVPVSNFLGWFFVALVIVGLFQRCDALFDGMEPPEEGGVGARRPARVLLGCGLWWGVLLFNLGIALWTSDVRRPETVSFLITAVLLHVPIFFFFMLRLAGGVAVAGGRGFEDA